jgi:predicted PurR-regulated permease PerM
LTAEASIRERLGTALFYGILALLAFLVFLIFQPFLAPLAWAGVIVVVLYPWHERLVRRWGRTRAAVTSTAGVTLIVIVPALIVMGEFVRQGISAARLTEQALSSGQVSWVNHMWDWISQRVPGESPADLATLAREWAQLFAGFLVSEVGVALRNVARFFFDLVVVIMAMFYFFRDADEIIEDLRAVLPFEDSHRETMIGEARDLIFGSVTSSLVAAAIHGLVGGIGFAVVGLSASIFWGVVMAFFSFIPLVGSSIVWLPASILLIVKGHPGRGIFLMVLCAGVVTFVDSFLRPWLISGRARLSGLLVFVSVLGGIAVFGMLGVVLGPIVVAMTASVLDLYTRRGSGPRTSTSQGKPTGGKRGVVLE